ncbi:MAG: YifB family Mg chelatase-like AAA ATPase [Pseudomonadota bacterium]
MSYAEVFSRAKQGLDAPVVQVEVHISNGLPAFAIVGLAETAVRESRDRVRSAIINSHFEFPDRRITVNLAPADLPKSGGRFDLPIALGILSASGQLPSELLQGSECYGELALDGSLRAVRGALSATLAATQASRRVILPSGNHADCALVPHSKLLSAPDLLSLCAGLRGHKISPQKSTVVCKEGRQHPDLARVKGQLAARRALEITAAGGHNLLMIGPAGTGKSLLASCLPSILPPLDDEEWLTVRALQDLIEAPALATARDRPFRAPHHSASAAALVGGGSVPRPGEISLAHGGVLFLDELAEFSRHTLDMLREPLENGQVSLARAACTVSYPAQFQLVAAMNPCICGLAGDSTEQCRCTQAQITSYQNRLSGPLLDRIDLQVRVERENPLFLLDDSSSESSDTVRRRVLAAVARQQTRGGRNCELCGDRLITACKVQRVEKEILRHGAEKLKLSNRAVERVLRVARTIADLKQQDTVDSDSIKEAIGYRIAA